MPERRRGRPPHPDLLTPAERRVLEELRKGGTNAEIAVRIGIGPETVKTHISNMLAKLELDDRQQLAAWREADGPRRRWLLTPFLLRPLVGLGVVAGVVVLVVVLLLLLEWLGRVDGQDTTPVLEVSAGADHTCVLRESGAIVCWGNNEHGQEEVPAGRYRSVSAGWKHSCAVEESGDVHCWGLNGEGQTDVPPGAYRSVSAGRLYTCAVRASGELACWGDNSFAQSDAPSGIYRAVAAGAYHTCAVDESWEPVCWGRNQEGQTDVPPGRFRSVTVGSWQTCGVRAHGRVACWGNIHFESRTSNLYGSVSTSRSLTCVGQSHRVHCWETDRLASFTYEGCTHTVFDLVRCVGGDVIAELLPSIARTELQVGSISVGESHACGVTESGAVECWGPGGSPLVDVPEALRAPELTE